MLAKRSGRGREGEVSVTLVSISQPLSRSFEISQLAVSADVWQRAWRNAGRGARMRGGGGEDGCELRSEYRSVICSSEGREALREWPGRYGISEADVDTDIDGMVCFSLITSQEGEGSGMHLDAGRRKSTCSTHGFRPAICPPSSPFKSSVSKRARGEQSPGDGRE